MAAGGTSAAGQHVSPVSQQNTYLIADPWTMTTPSAANYATVSVHSAANLRALAPITLALSPAPYRGGLSWAPAPRSVSHRNRRWKVRAGRHRLYAILRHSARGSIEGG